DVELLVLLEPLDRLPVQVDGLRPLLPLLVGARLFLEGLDAHGSGSGCGWVSDPERRRTASRTRAGTASPSARTAWRSAWARRAARSATCRARRGDRRREGEQSRRCNLAAAGGSAWASGTMPIPPVAVIRPPSACTRSSTRRNTAKGGVRSASSRFIE